MISAWLSAHIQAINQAWRRLIAQPLASALSVVVIGIAVTLPLGLFVVFENAATATDRLDVYPTINVYLQLSAQNEDIRQVERRLKALPNTEGATFISRESALAEMKRASSVADLLVGMDVNPLPNSFVLQPRSIDPELMQAMRTEIAAIPKIETVVMDFEWALKLRRFVNFALHMIVILSSVLAFAVVFVTGNTIRLQMLTRRDEIDVSRLIGASSRFVRRPFLYFGAAQGLLAGLLAIVGLMLLLGWANIEVRALTASYGFDFSLKFLTLHQMLLLITGTAALGWLGAYGSVALYLRQHRTR